MGVKRGGCLNRMDRQKNAGYMPALFKLLGLGFYLCDDYKPANIAGKLPSQFKGFKGVDFIASFNRVFDCHDIDSPIVFKQGAGLPPAWFYSSPSSSYSGLKS